MAYIHIDRFLETCIRIGADDLYLTPGRPPELWINGALRGLETRAPDVTDTDRIAREITPAANWAEFSNTGETTFEMWYSARATQFRVTVSREHGEVAMVFRRVRS
jgi:twitching motility protein PilT